VINGKHHHIAAQLHDKLAIGGGAMRVRAAPKEVYPETRQQRCGQHTKMSVLNRLPKPS